MAHATHWRKLNLAQAVTEGFRIGEECGEVFTWLTATNKGAAKVCMAALENMGITEDDLRDGCPCDPQTKSNLNILARPGIILRLSRNLDKVRGFVNGAVCVVVESLRGNTVLTAQLLSSGNYMGGGVAHASTCDT